MKYLHVITGGPGAGKTSLIAALAREGLHLRIPMIPAACSNLIPAIIPI